MSFINNCDKLLKEIEILLKKPHLLDGQAGIIITRQQLAGARIAGIATPIYKNTRKEYTEEFKEARVTVKKFERVTKSTFKELIITGKKFLSLEQKQKIFEIQQELLEKKNNETGESVITIPDYLKITKEELVADENSEKENFCSNFNGFINKTPEEIVTDYSNLFDIKRRKIKRKPSARNKFIGEMMREGMDMKEASDLWKTVPEKDREKYL